MREVTRMSDVALATLNERAPIPPLCGQSPERFVSVIDAAGQLHVHPSTIYRWIHSGRFPSRVLRVGGRWRIDRDALTRWMEAQ
jgi:excisionase family DNA binding protein